MTHHNASDTAPSIVAQRAAPGTLRRRRFRIAVMLTALFAALVAAVAGTVVAAVPAQACCTPPEHAIIVCESASFYANYDSSSGPTGYRYQLYYGNKVGHTRGAHPVYNGWAATFDYGPNVWGYVRYECLGGWGSW